MAKFVYKFQEGGAMPQDAPAPEAQGAPAEGGQQGGDPLQQMIEMAMQAVQTQDGQLALQVCEMLLEVAGVSGQGGAQAYRMGGRLMRR